MADLYAAYGSNLHIGQMNRRCPRAEPLGRDALRDTRMIFRGVADIVREPGAQCPIGVWRITDECLKALDQYEGYPSLYERCNIETRFGTAITYYMRRGDVWWPGQSYLDTIAEGYENFSLDLKYLEDSVDWTGRNLKRGAKTLMGKHPLPRYAKSKKAIFLTKTTTSNTTHLTGTKKRRSKKKARAV